MRHLTAQPNDRTCRFCQVPRDLLAALTVAGLLAAPGIASAQTNVAVNGTFDAGITPWVFQENDLDLTGDDCDDYSTSLETGDYTTLTVQNYNSCDPISGYELQIGQTVSVQEGYSYQISFWAQAMPPYTSGFVHVLLANDDTEYFREENVTVPQTSGADDGISYQSPAFVAEVSGEAWFGLFLGGDWDVKLDSLMLVETPPGVSPGGEGTVFSNQIGFAPSLPKVATVRASETSPLAWELRSSTGAVLDSGSTVVLGSDASSGDSAHRLDFSSYQATGTGLKLAIGDHEGAPFAISSNVYASLKRDALRFFYYQRSGTAITQSYAGGSQWVRAAGHPDTSASCLPGTCDYALNVSKGWYDAGDYGKYVVNGGFAVWALQSQYERLVQIGTTLAEYADGTLNIPEGTNGIPDLLDEARYEMTFMLGMQVPEGETYAGMAHHKVHGEEWPPRPTWPEDDTQSRYLHLPSTAATLNLAATAAQCARLWPNYDATFAERCLTAAERAWTAAKAHPNMLASSTDDEGGGTYSDTVVDDEFYWAAAELFITTGKSEYAEFLRNSSAFATLPASDVPFNWADTAGLGTFDLAFAPNRLSLAEVTQVRTAVVAAADAFVATVDESGYGAPIASFFWGSNSSVLSAGMVTALAYDITHDAKYERAATSALNYVLGNNPLGECYVTGYGSRPFSNVHHRIFAHDVDSSFPVAPPGFLAGGANETLDGLVPQGALEDCVGMKCWTDDSDAYGLTEVAINWNAVLAWVSGWLDEMATNPPSDALGIDTGFSGLEGTGGTGDTNTGGTGANEPGTGGTNSGGGGASPGTGGSEASGGSGGSGGTLASQGGMTEPEPEVTAGADGGGDDSAVDDGSEAAAGQSSTDSSGECSPGRTSSCTGKGKCAGRQRCDDDGSWEACVCSSDGAAGTSSDPETSCEPGDSRECTGRGACEGGQSCADDGSWDDCECSDSRANESDDGCGCRVPGARGDASRATQTLFASLLAALALVRRARRRGPCRSQQGAVHGPALGRQLFAAQTPRATRGCGGAKAFGRPTLPSDTSDTCLPSMSPTITRNEITKVSAIDSSSPLRPIPTEVKASCVGANAWGAC